MVALAAVFRAYDAPDAPVAGTLSVAGPRARMTDARIVELAPLLLDATHKVAELWPLRMRQPAGPNAGTMPTAPTLTN